MNAIAGSSNGRTHASGAWYWGSSPCPAVGLITLDRVIIKV